VNTFPNAKLQFGIFGKVRLDPAERRFEMALLETRNGFRFRRWIGPIGGLVVLVPLGVYSFRSHGSVEGTLRVGFQNSPPYHFPDAQNHPTGPAVEIIKRAAQERNIHLEWVFSPEGPERALSSGTVDLWPLVADLRERRKLLYVTAPWARLTYTIVNDSLSPEGASCGARGRHGQEHGRHVED
jgi:Bacterial extracellular solute-binding proteins, family 3